MLSRQPVRPIMRFLFVKRSAEGEKWMSQVDVNSMSLLRWNWNREPAGAPESRCRCDCFTAYRAIIFASFIFNGFCCLRSFSLIASTFLLILLAPSFVLNDEWSSSRQRCFCSVNWMTARETWNVDIDSSEFPAFSALLTMQTNQDGELNSVKLSQK